MVNKHFLTGKDPGWPLTLSGGNRLLFISSPRNCVAAGLDQALDGTDAELRDGGEAKGRGRCERQNFYVLRGFIVCTNLTRAKGCPESW